MLSLLRNIFNPQEIYRRGHRSGWFACESMVIERIKEHYPEEYKELVRNLLQ